MMRHLMFIALLWGVPVFGAKPEYTFMGADIFDPKAPGEELVAGAVRQARSADKRILVLFGANWCPWCRRLHAALTKEPAIQARLRDKFILVFADANTRNDKNRNAALLERYGNPTLQFGLPVFVILDREGKQIGTRETASLAADTDAKVAHNILTFLGEWSK